MAKRKLKMGMVGGGPGAFIGDVHRKAARLDGQIDIVAGAFDVDPKKSKQTGKELMIDPNRAYSDYTTMIAEELKLPPGERVDFITIVTPNFLHYPIARDFLNAGFHVLCEKPMTLTLKEAKALQKLVKKTGLIFGLNHNYTGYPMVKLAKEMVAKGDLGKIRKIVSIYPQGWLATALEKTGQTQASWRTDPKRSGAGCVGDIGSHAENLAEYITGLKITDVCADLSTFVKGRLVDDDISVLLKFNNGAKGIVYASQISIGHENGLAIWVHGEKKSLEWHQEHPNYLKVKYPGGPEESWQRGNDYIGKKSKAAAHGTRLPAGHPEAFFEALANLYSNFTDAVNARLAGKKPSGFALDFPGVDDGVRGMQFIETVLQSDKSSKKWTKFKN
jgi:predicted dehydrogenase